MKRFYLDEFPSLADQEPAVAERVRALIRDSTSEFKPGASLKTD